MTDELARKIKVFKGLALPDVERSWTPGGSSNGESDHLPDGSAVAKAVQDSFAMLESLEGEVTKGKTDGTTRKRGRQSDSNSHDNARSGRPRYVSRSRSRSRERRQRRHHITSDKVENEGDGDGRRGDGKRSRGRQKDHDEVDLYSRPVGPREVDNQPILFKIYGGQVTGVKDFGAFVNLQGVKGKVDGLVHVSALQDGVRVNHPSDLVAKDQFVRVKVISIEGHRIGLSMKEVDQVTGRDLMPQKRIASAANMEPLNRGATNSKPNGRYGNFDATVPFQQHRLDGTHAGKSKRLTSPERWEIKQLIASGALSADALHNGSDDDAAAAGTAEDDLDEDIDIEVRDEEPPFLAGQTKQSLELSPIRIVKAPDGSLNRAAMAGTTLVKDWRELRQQETQAKEQTAQVDLNAQWQDPMMDPGQRKFASELRRPQATSSEDQVPEWKRDSQNKNTSFGKRTTLSIKEQRESLPVYKFRSQIIEAVKAHQLLVLVGDTGSGKTTQVTQYLAESGFANEKIIGCTQPRRVAAISVAKRVAEEVGCQVGQEVGYTIRFEDCTSPQTKIKYMTDGILQREVLLDPDLNRYSVILLDEAHERSIATDVLFGLLKKTLKRRADLKVIVTSATLDADKFSEYFNQCPILTIPGRAYPVEIMYSREPESDYLDAALTTVMQIHLTESPGDILLFLTGQEEIDTSCEILFQRMKALGPDVPDLVILPVYSALPSHMQSRIFEPAPPGSRKVVIATNIAETSITIDQIYYVIDPGFSKQSAYDPKLGMDSLVVMPISQAQAKQRAGRAGRTGPGKCFRLYTEVAYQSEMLPSPIPEIQRQNLSHTILMLKAMGINNLLQFDFMDPPPTNTMLTALEELYALSALDDEGLLTRLGRKMADFPMEPTLAKVLIASIDLGCSDEMLSIVAMVSVPSIFYRPKEKQQQADQKKSKFHDPHGDHLTLLNVYNAWKSSNFSSPWCYENFIDGRSIRRAQDVRQQLVTIMERYKHPIVSSGRDTVKVRQALCSGFFRNAARKDPQEGYKTLTEGTVVYLHPSSALFGRPAEHVIFDTLVLTTKEYMHSTTAIEPKVCLYPIRPSLIFASP